MENFESGKNFTFRAKGIRWEIFLGNRLSSYCLLQFFLWSICI